MKPEPLVSVLTTCRNPMPYLRECVASVRAQTWPAVEHVIQDAASTDGAPEFLASPEAAGARWNSAPDSGEYQGLNRALARARGDILVALNADDALLPHACAWAVEQFALHPEAAVIYGDEIIIDAQGREVMRFVAPEYDFRALLCVEIVPPAQAAFIRRDRLADVGLHVDESFRDCGDFELWVRLGLRHPFRHVPEFVTRYRWHDNKSRRPDEVARHVEAKQRVLERFFADPDRNREFGGLRGRALAGLLLWASESCLGLGDAARARDYLRQALEHAPDPAKFGKYCPKLLAMVPDAAQDLAAAPARLLDALPAALRPR